MVTVEEFSGDVDTGEVTVVEFDRGEVPVSSNAEKPEARIDLVVEEDDASVDSDIDNNEVNKHDVDECDI